MEIVLSEQAETDLLQIYRYVAERNVASAESIVDRIDRQFENLRHFPFIGRARSSLGEEIRSLVSDSYVIFYEVTDTRIVIVRVLDGRRDIDAEFQR
jgi:toxin ParE1/3/4